MTSASISVKKRQIRPPGFFFNASAIPHASRPRLHQTVQCGGEYFLNNTHHGRDAVTIKTPNYPSSYPDNVECIWKFHIQSYPPAEAYQSLNTQLDYIILNFDSPINIEHDAKCRYDYVEVSIIIVSLSSSIQSLISN